MCLASKVHSSFKSFQVARRSISIHLFVMKPRDLEPRLKTLCGTGSEWIWHSWIFTTPYQQYRYSIEHPISWGSLVNLGAHRPRYVKGSTKDTWTMKEKESPLWRSHQGSHGIMEPLSTQDRSAQNQTSNTNNRGHCPRTLPPVLPFVDLGWAKTELCQFQ